MTFRRPSEVRFIELIARGKTATGVSSRVMAGAVLGWNNIGDYDGPFDSGDTQ